MQNKDYPKLSRKSFLSRLALGGGALLAASAWGWKIWRKSQVDEKEIPVRMMGASHKRGHRLREKAPAFLPDETRTVDVLIVGAGISGLGAAWELKQRGWKDFWVLDLEDEAGGNSSSGQNEVSAYPWGAHYLPIPDPNNKPLIRLLEEIGVVKCFINGLPWYDEAFLCHAPHERLLIHGTWQEGLVPSLGVPEEERIQIAAFHVKMEEFKRTIGSDGMPGFAIPVAMSSKDEQFLELDTLTMQEWMLAQGWDSEHLHAYVNYCCRDDFGVEHSICSAWAGVHYFAARGGHAENATDSDVLTWPEGNGWLVKRLAEQLPGKIATGHLVTALRNTEQGVEADVLRMSDGKKIRVNARAAICATPRFVAERIVEGLKPLKSFTYAPWVVANITLSNRPEGRGAPLSWDNVAYDGKSLGYIVADHQALSGSKQPKTVLTWYMPLSDQEPSLARKWAIDQTPEAWREEVLGDLESMHPGISAQVEQVDVWVWGHGMIRPLPGFITGQERQDASGSVSRIAFAHSDLSGISIFEEAFYWGGNAAGQVTQWLNG